MNVDSPRMVPRGKYRSRATKPDIFPDASLASLSTTSKEVVDNLKKPGIMSDSDDEECADTKKKIIESLTKSMKKNNTTPSGARMPGTLQTPNASFFEPTQAEQDMARGEGSRPQSRRTTANDGAPQNRPIVRSLSVEEREAFLADLHEASKVPPACVYVFPMRDIPRIKRSAEKAGFHACVVNVSGPIADKIATDGWLILGREKQAVQLLKAEVECRRKGDHADERRGQKVAGTMLRAVAGGAVVGAVVTFTRL
jgi:hypothetical protein